MDMASNTYPQYLAGLVKDGTLKLDDIDAAVRPILAVKVRMGLFEQPYADESELARVVALPEHREEARRSAQRSMVLLRNEGQLLPLAKSLQNVAVIGPLADSKEATEGSWMVFGHTSPRWPLWAGDCDYCAIGLVITLIAQITGVLGS
jgi:beta-glucosidase